MAAVASAFALRADAGGTVQFEMDDASLAGRHGVEVKGLAGFAHALGGHARGKLQLLNSKLAKVATIEADVRMKPRLEAEPADGDIFESHKQLPVALEEQVLLASVKIHDNFRSFRFAGSSVPAGRPFA